MQRREFMTLFDGDPAVWHNGERALQALTGKREAMERRGRVVLRDHMPDQHRLFFSERNQLFLAALDASGQPWATLVEGDAGFVTSPSPGLLAVAAILPASDPASEAFDDGVPVGVLGLEFETRRRNRVYGEIRYAPGAAGFSIEVAQSFGNCPQYIQERRLVSVESTRDGSLPGPVRRTATIADDASL